MNNLSKMMLVGAAVVVLSSGCSGGSGSTATNTIESTTPLPGSVSVSLTDGPWEDARALVLTITGVELGHSNGDVIHLDPRGGPMSIDMMQLQNGLFESLVEGADVPTGQYHWMRLQIDLDESYLDLAGTGGRHNMRMGQNAIDGLEVQQSFQILESTNYEFMLDFDLRQGVQHHHMGMMGDEYELHSAMRLVNMDDVGGLTGMVDISMIDVNHPDCSQEPGGNWAYLFPGDATDPDDIAQPESDGISGPMAIDRVEMNPTTGEYHYFFGYLPAGSYRIATTCSGEWDEDNDDDYPADPDGMFDFQMFSEPFDVVAGQMHNFDMAP